MLNVAAAGALSSVARIQLQVAVTREKPAMRHRRHILLLRIFVRRGQFAVREVWIETDDCVAINLERPMDAVRKA
jgi:hypothetical protein